MLCSRTFLVRLYILRSCDWPGPASASTNSNPPIPSALGNLMTWICSPAYIYRLRKDRHGVIRHAPQNIAFVSLQAERARKAAVAARTASRQLQVLSQSPCSAIRCSP